MSRSALRAAPVAASILVVGLCTAESKAQTCPLSSGATDSAKSHKLYLYFPAASDATFPNYTTNASPVPAFNAALLNPSIGTTAQLVDEIRKVVVDDYCEFNVQVLSTTAAPDLMPSPPARRVTVAIGVDGNGGAWGQSQEVDIGDTVNVDYARVWAGTYTTCEGGNPPTGMGCSSTGSLTGANATLEHWAQAIGGTAAHEAGHTFGLSHTDDDLPTDPGGQPGPAPTPGEDSFSRHLMPAGYNLSGPDRANFRRHFSNRTYGLLANNVGLSIQTMHNWDLTNPNAQQAQSLAIDFLSPRSSLTMAWTYGGPTSPWINPILTGPSGTAVFKGQTYNRYRATWSTGNPAWTGSAPGVVAGGNRFHIGATFTGVDFNQPDPIIIQNVTLFDAANNQLALNPRLPAYDAGTVDTANGTMSVRFFPPAGGATMRLAGAAIYQLPRVASLESMVGDGRPLTRGGDPIQPWARTECALQSLRDGGRCVVARLAQRPHVQVAFRLGEPNVVDCRNGVPRMRPPASGVREQDSIYHPDYEGPVIQGPRPMLAPPARTGQDSTAKPDYEGPFCAGTQRDPFPSTTVYIVARFVEPEVRHFDPERRRYVVGPVTSTVFYQFAGTRRLQAGRR